MAYGVIIRASAATAEGTHTVEILRDGYVGPVHEVAAAAPVFYSEEYGQRGADIGADIRPSQVTAHFVVTSGSPALDVLRAAMQAEPREYRVHVRRGSHLYWQGYLMPLTTSTRVEDGTQLVQVTAKDRPRSLDEMAFVDEDGQPHEGPARLDTILRRELARVGHSITNEVLIPYFNPVGVFDGFGVEVDQARFYRREEDETVAMPSGAVVRSILEAQQAQVTQFNGSWHVVTPHATGVVSDITAWVARQDELSGEPPSRSGQARYLVGEVKTAVRNGSFEAGITQQQGIPGGPAFEWEGIERHATSIALDGAAVGSIPVRETDTPLTEAQTRTRQTESGFQLIPVVPGAGKMRFSANLNVDIRHTDGRVVRAEGTRGYVYASFRLVRQDLYYDEDSDSWVSGSRRVLLGAPFAFSIWAHREITLPQVPEGDDLEVRLMGAILDSPLSGGDTGEIGEKRTLFDLVTLDAELDEGEQSITYTSFSPEAEEGESPQIDILIGDGPFAGAAGAILRPDGELASDWRVGQESRTAPHTQLLAEYLMRTRGRGRRRLKLTTAEHVPTLSPVARVRVDGGSYWPVYLRIDWPRGQATVEALELIDIPVPGGLRQSIEHRPRMASGAAGDAWRVYEDLSERGYITPDDADERYLRQTGGTLTGDLVFAGGGRLRGKDDALHVYDEAGTNHGVLTVGVLRVLDHVDSYQTDILEVEDQYIKVNRGQPSPDLNGGLIVERGSVDSYLEFDEGRERWGWRMGADLNDGTFRAFVDEDRSISAGTGLAGGGTLAQDRQFALTGQALALHNLGTTGLIGRTSGGNIVSRSIATSGSGLSVADGNASGGNPTLSLSDRLQGVHGAANGLLVGTSNGAASRTIQGTTNQVLVANGNGVSGNPTLSLPQDIHTGATPEFAGGTYTGDVAGQRGWIDRRIPWAATDEDVYLLIGPIDTSSPGSNLSGVFTGARAISSGGAGVVQIRVAYRRISGSTSHRVSADILDSSVLGDDVRLYDVTHGGERWVALSFTGISAHVSPDSMTFSGLAENVEIKSVLGSEVTNATAIAGHGKYTLNVPEAQFLGQGRFADFLTLDKQATSTSHALRADRTLRIQGTANRISVSNDSALNLTSNRSWQITAPQDLHTDADFLTKTLRTKDWAGSTSFASGWTGHGWRAEDDHLEVTDLTVRNRLRVYELLIEQIRANNGSVAISNAAEVASVSGSTITLDEGVPVPFVVGDILRAQRFTGEGVYVSMIRVTSVGSGSFGFTLLDGDAPAAGMEYVRVGNTTDEDRQGLVYLTASDSGAPYIDIIDGIDDHTKWNSSDVVRSRFGRLDGLTVPGFGQLDGYGAYIQRGYIDKEVIVGGAGLSIDSFQQRPSALWHFDGSLVDTISGATPEGYEDAEITDYGLVTGPGLVATLRRDGKFGGGVAVEAATENLISHPFYFDSGTPWYTNNFTFEQVPSYFPGQAAAKVTNNGEGNSRAMTINLGYAIDASCTVSILIEQGNAVGVDFGIYTSNGWNDWGYHRFRFDNPVLYLGSGKAAEGYSARRIGRGPNGGDLWHLTVTNTSATVGESQRFYLYATTMSTNTDYNIIHAVQFEEKPFATSFVEGTRHHAGHVNSRDLSPFRSLVFRFRPTTSTVAENDGGIATSSQPLFRTYEGGTLLCEFVTWTSRPAIRTHHPAGNVLRGWVGEPDTDYIGVWTLDGDTSRFRIYDDKGALEQEWIQADPGFESNTPNRVDFRYFGSGVIFSEALTLPYVISDREIRRIALSDAPIQERPSQVRITGEQILVGTDTLIKDGFIQSKYIAANSLTTEQLNFTPLLSADGTGDIIATINATSEGLRIAANKIHIDGTTTFSSGYDPSEKATPNDIDDAIDAYDDTLGDLSKQDLVEKAQLGETIIDGAYIRTDLLDVDSIFAQQASIGGWQIDYNALTGFSDIDTGSSSWLAYHGFANSGIGGQSDGKDAILFVSAENRTGLNAMFRVNADGELWAENAHIKGEITAESGAYEGYMTAGQARIGLDVIGPSYDGISLDTDYNFWVRHRSTGQTWFRVGTDTDFINFEGGNLGIFTPNFEVDYAGNVTAAGKLTLESGSQIGPWDIDNNGITGWQDVAATFRYYGLRFPGETPTDRVLFLGGTNASGANAPFYVQADGKLFATGAEISGTLSLGTGSSVGGFGVDGPRLTVGDVRIDADTGTRGLAVSKSIPGLGTRDVLKIGDYTPGSRVDLTDNVPRVLAAMSNSHTSPGWSDTSGPNSGLLQAGYEVGILGDQIAAALFTWSNIQGQMVRFTMRIRNNHGLQQDASVGYSIWFMGHHWERMPTLSNKYEYYDITYDTGWFLATNQTEMVLSILSPGTDAGMIEALEYQMTMRTYTTTQTFLEQAPGLFRLYEGSDGRGIFYENHRLDVNADEMTISGKPAVRWRGAFASLNEADQAGDIRNGDIIRAGSSTYMRDSGRWITI